MHPCKLPVQSAKIAAIHIPEENYLLIFGGNLKATYKFNLKEFEEIADKFTEQICLYPPCVKLGRIINVHSMHGDYMSFNLDTKKWTMIMSPLVKSNEPYVKVF